MYQVFYHEANHGLLEKDAPRNVCLSQSLNWLHSQGWEVISVSSQPPYHEIVARKWRDQC